MNLVTRLANKPLSRPIAAPPACHERVNRVGRRTALVTKNYTEEGHQGHEDLEDADGALYESDHRVVQNHRHAVIEQTLAEHEEVQADIDVDLLEDGEDGNGVDGGDETGEDEALGGGEVLLYHGARVDGGVDHEAAQEPSLGQSVETVTNCEGVEESPEDGEDHDGEEVVEEGLIIEREGRVQDDGGQEVIEEELSCELGEWIVRLVLDVKNVVNNDVVNDDTGNDTDNYQDA